MRPLARMTVVVAMALSGCSGSSGPVRSSVLYARVELVDNAGAVSQSVDLVSDGDAGPSVPITRNVPQRIRVTWFAADSTPDASAADPSLSMRFGIPLTPYGLSFVQSPAARYEGTMTGTVLQPSPVFVPLQLFDNRTQNVVFSIMAHFTVQ